MIDDVKIMITTSISNNDDDNIVDDIKWYKLLWLWGIESYHYESMAAHSD